MNSMPISETMRRQPNVSVAIDSGLRISYRGIRFSNMSYSLAPIDQQIRGRIPLDSGTVVPYYGTLSLRQGGAS